MPNVFLVSDTHFGHNGVTKFLKEDGTKVRPWDSVEEMDEVLIDNWNKTVSNKDLVYHLGDVVMNRRCLETVRRLNGEKVLIRGNHDVFRLEELTKFFKDIMGSHVLHGMLLTHIPIHPDSLYRYSANIHGHLHEKRVMLNGEIDKRYYSVSVEQINYTPISLEDLVKKVNVQQG